MILQNKIYKLEGKIQHYAWGGFSFIPAWLGIGNPEHKTFAEYWMGAHSSASSVIIDDDKKISLYELIKKNPAEFLSEKVAAQFENLPYLFKILDVHDMLSIQVHPSKNEAENGFEREEKAGIDINAADRNYKDRNHKPEMMIALSEFYLLHGFKKKDKLRETLRNEVAFENFIPIFKEDNYKALYEHVMKLPQNEVDVILLPLIQKEMDAKKNNLLTKNDAGWWVAKLFEKKEVKDNFDRGIFSIYFFNIVCIDKGDAIYQDAGVPHAYLEGQNMELMASSDNVLRAGLTNKHIDIDELMKHVEFKGIEPQIIHGKKINDAEKNYPASANDFGISKIELEKNQRYEKESSSFEIFCVMEGALKITGSNTLHAKRGEVFAVLPEEEYTLSATQPCVLYKAFVP